MKRPSRKIRSGAVAGFILSAFVVLGGWAAQAAPMATRQTIVAACTASPPRAGATFSGPVLQVLDGATFCVAQGPTPPEWILVRLGNRPDPSARGDLMGVSFARKVVCTAGSKRGRAVIARCTVDGVGIDSLLRAEAARPTAPWR